MIHWLWWLIFYTLLSKYMLRQCGVYSLEPYVWWLLSVA